MNAAARNRAFGLLFLTFFVWGSVYVAGKMVMDYMSPFLVGCMRCVIAMLPLGFMARKSFGTKIAREDRKYFLLIGGMGYFATIQLTQLGIALTGASTAALINAMTPISVTIMAALILKEKITRITLLCLALSIGGTLIVTNGTSGEGQLYGIAAVVLSIICWGAASVFMRRMTAKYPPILVTTYSMALSLIFHIPVGIGVLAAQGARWDLKCVLCLLYLGLVGSGVAQYTWTKCLSVLPASTCSMFYPLQAVFSALLGAFLLGETFTSSFFFGLLLISADVVLSTREAKKQTS